MLLLSGLGFAATLRILVDGLSLTGCGTKTHTTALYRRPTRTTRASAARSASVRDNPPPPPSSNTCCTDPFHHRHTRTHTGALALYRGEETLWGVWPKATIPILGGAEATGSHIQVGGWVGALGGVSGFHFRMCVEREHHQRACIIRV